MVKTPEPEAPRFPKRDLAKPEQMTPEERELAGNQEAIRLAKQDYELAKTGQTRGYSDRQTYKSKAAAVKDTKSRLDRASTPTELGTYRAASDHYGEVDKALNNQAPVSADAVETYGNVLPEGYVKQGDMYVYLPQEKAPVGGKAPAVKAPAAKAPVAPAAKAPAAKAPAAKAPVAPAVKAPAVKAPAAKAPVAPAAKAPAPAVSKKTVKKSGIPDKPSVVIDEDVVDEEEALAKKRAKAAANDDDDEVEVKSPSVSGHTKQLIVLKAALAEVLGHKLTPAEETKARLIIMRATVSTNSSLDQEDLYSYAIGAAVDFVRKNGSFDKLNVRNLLGGRAAKAVAKNQKREGTDKEPDDYTPHTTPAPLISEDARVEQEKREVALEQGEAFREFMSTIDKLTRKLQFNNPSFAKEAKETMVTTMGLYNLMVDEGAETLGDLKRSDILAVKKRAATYLGSDSAASVKDEKYEMLVANTILQQVAPEYLRATEKLKADFIAIGGREADRGTGGSATKSSYHESIGAVGAAAIFHAKATAQGVLNSGGTIADMVSGLPPALKEQWDDTITSFGADAATGKVSLLHAMRKLSQNGPATQRILCMALAKYNSRALSGLFMQIEASLGGADGEIDFSGPSPVIRIAGLGEKKTIATTANHEVGHAITAKYIDAFYDNPASLPAGIYLAIHDAEIIRNFLNVKLIERQKAGGFPISAAFTTIAAMPESTPAERQAKKRAVSVNLRILATARTNPNLTPEQAESAYLAHYLERAAYGASSLHEYFAESMTNEEFQRLLNDTSASGLGKLNSSGESKGSLWDRLKAVFRQMLFGGKPLDPTSLLAKTFNVTIDLLSTTGTAPNVRLSRGTMFEVAPDPANAPATAEWERLNQTQRTEVTKEVADRQLSRLATDMGLPNPDLEYTIGGFGDTVNPSVIIRFPESVSYEKVTEYLTAAGVMLHQNSVIAYDEDATEGENVGYFVNLTPSRDLDTTEIESLFTRLRDASGGLAEGFTLRDGTIIIGNFSDMSSEDFYKKIEQAINEVVKDDDYDVAQEAHQFRSDFILTAESALEQTQYGKSTTTDQSTTGEETIRGREGRFRAIQSETDALYRRAVNRFKGPPTDEDLIDAAKRFQSAASVEPPPTHTRTNAELDDYNTRQIVQWKQWAEAEGGDLNDQLVLADYAIRYAALFARPTALDTADTTGGIDPLAIPKARLDARWEASLEAMKTDGILVVNCP